MAIHEQTTTRTRRRAILCSTRRVVGLLAIIAGLVAVGLVVVPAALPNLVTAMRSNPTVPFIVALFWVLATVASITGKRAICTGYLSWTETATAHIGGTVANRIVPAGVGAAGVFAAALHRGGASNTAAAGVIALWAMAGGLAHAGGLLLGVAWLREGWSGLLTVVALATLLVVAVRLLAGWLSRRRAARAERVAASPARFGAHPAVRTARAGSSLPAVVAPPSKWRRLVLTARDVLDAVRARPILALAALTAQLAAAACLATGFALAAVSFGVPISVGVAMAAYLAGTALSAATPTPAGIGSAETALIGTLMLAGASLGEALPTVFLFRAVILIAPVVAAALMAAAWVSVRLVVAARARRRTARMPHPHLSALPAMPAVILAIEPSPAPEAAAP
ncbi:lysylphosphatidylglycerol synthase domain-containing protein [Jiangella ureilytica]|uniref:lysylphosphatidylglycerol synthase domain-containing protein n=1 Tax=Jiangella ureilytica TaxID=2530374 RepID=UPI0013A5E24D|nr:lysylphosphatidylglycerol synthase domain-containing protein [Jiangella ureilytica]